MTFPKRWLAPSSALASWLWFSLWWQAIALAMGHAESKAYIEKMTAIYKELVAGLKK